MFPVLQNGLLHTSLADLTRARVMSTEIGESVQKRIETVISEQFDAFERQDREIRIEERRERAMQLRLPTAIAHLNWSAQAFP
jgi:hypothetical protein